MTDDEILEAVRRRIAAGRPTDIPGHLMPPAPAAEETVAAAEQTIGYRLSPLLRRIYLEVADGGVGPFDGIDGVGSDPMVGDYVAYREATLEPDEPPPPPEGVLFLCDFGCAQWSLLDCRHPEGRMWWWEEGSRYKLRLTFPEWLQAWLEGRLDALLHDPELRLADEAWIRPDD
jgi:hypothetical protein